MPYIRHCSHHKQLPNVVPFWGIIEFHSLLNVFNLCGVNDKNLTIILLSHSQKEKVPDVAQSVRGDVKKRSELSSKLLEEATKLEMMEGRQQVKTRKEKSPFNRINNQAVGDVGGFSGNFKGQQSSRGGQLTLSGA